MCVCERERVPGGDRVWSECVRERGYPAVVALARPTMLEWNISVVLLARSASEGARERKERRERGEGERKGEREGAREKRGKKAIAREKERVGEGGVRLYITSQVATWPTRSYSRATSVLSWWSVDVQMFEGFVFLLSLNSRCRVQVVLRAAGLG